MTVPKLSGVFWVVALTAVGAAVGSIWVAPRLSAWFSKKNGGES